MSTAYDLFGKPAGLDTPRYVIDFESDSVADDFAALLFAHDLPTDRLPAGRVKIGQTALDMLRSLRPDDDGSLTEDAGEIQVWIGGNPYPLTPATD